MLVRKYINVIKIPELFFAFLGMTQKSKGAVIPAYAGIYITYCCKKTDYLIKI
ncbi:MAG: hypothetical protein ACK5UE_12305 [Chitinophagales bacterium]|jgi:hypothetical protein